MKRFATLLLSALPLLAQASDDPLQAERWNTRPLIVLAASADDPLLARVQAALREPANREAFVERDMVLYTVIGQQGQRNEQPLDVIATKRLLLALDAGSARPQVILVGKDGGKKIQQGADADLQAIFQTIDRMPMRQSE
ncbi:DUF4174 domain-containing protein [Pseudomonas sp. URMO17WK12:I2]|uniref:DUF4174 domain-containing protein n=1 Tax=Pseudomonas sp. URMO17WK12:I2 TaxID=1261623 RepID=UPI000DAB8D04|nr:DUF4174 domain-containing protein [Pseudomonas sp. URMO17WK12:I2]PZW41230.1 uncharacterized protein DUF4174 [Pseudomonas sp. URMO17WK12:I2]